MDRADVGQINWVNKKTPPSSHPRAAAEILGLLLGFSCGCFLSLCLVVADSRPKTKHVWMSWTVKARTTYGQKLRDLLVETNLPKWSGKKSALLHYNLSRVHNYCVQFQNHKKKEEVSPNPPKRGASSFLICEKELRFRTKSGASLALWMSWWLEVYVSLGTRWPYKSDKFGVGMTFLYRSNHTNLGLTTDDTIIIGTKWLTVNLFRDLWKGFRMNQDLFSHSVHQVTICPSMYIYITC